MTFSDPVTLPEAARRLGVPSSLLYSLHYRRKNQSVPFPPPRYSSGALGGWKAWDWEIVSGWWELHGDR